MNTSESHTSLEPRGLSGRVRSGEPYTLSVTHDQPTTTDRPHICGRIHHVENYERGCGYGTYIVRAIEASLDGDHNTSSYQATLADHTLWPLGDVSDPTLLRDFLAGAQHAFDTYLRAIGTPDRSGCARRDPLGPGQ